MGAGRLALLTLWFCASTATAAQPAAQAQLIRDGERLYGAGKYQEAAQLLLKAYALGPDPRLAFDIARAWDQAGELAKALEYYQRYVSAEGTDAAVLKRSLLSIDRIKALLAKEEQARQAREVEQKRLAETEAARKTAQEEADRSAAKLRAQEQAEAAARARGRSKVAFWAVGGTAVAAAATGGMFGYLADHTYQQFHNATTVPAKLSLESDAKRDAAVADVCFAVGLVGAGAAFFLYPRDSSAVTVSVGPGGASVEAHF
jgi:tetratricopeptide (TPR) repeat protein